MTFGRFVIVFVSSCLFLGLCACAYQGCYHRTTPLPALPSQLVAVAGTSLAKRHVTEPMTPQPFSSSLLGTLNMGLRGKKIRRRKREAREFLKTPARLETPYGFIRLSRPPSVCFTCRGRGVCRCTVCEGRGLVRASGMQKQNQLPRKLEGSKWTSVEVYRGHRHHSVMEARGSPRSRDDDSYQVRMRNCCGPSDDFWIPVNEIRDKRMEVRSWMLDFASDVRAARYCRA
jgi:hypothetical protein